MKAVASNTLWLQGCEESHDHDPISPVDVKQGISVEESFVISKALISTVIMWSCDSGWDMA